MALTFFSIFETWWRYRSDDDDDNEDDDSNDVDDDDRTQPQSVESLRAEYKTRQE